MVCRVRKRDDDLRAGVGGQRGIGMHMRWVKEQKARAGAGSVGLGLGGASGDGMDELASDVVPEMLSSLSISGDNESGSQFRRQRQRQESSDSYASSNSSILARFFPQRYFILKSLTQFDLDLSTKEGLWATQKHNEGILDQAFRTSQDVFLIFSVNKSGEFYGYARMVGPIRRGEHKVSWASRTPDAASSRSRSSTGANGRGQGRGVDEKGSSASSSKNRNQNHNHNKTPASASLALAPVTHQDCYVQSPLPIDAGTDADADTEHDSGSGTDSQKQGPPTSFPAVTDNAQSAPAEFGAAWRGQQSTIEVPMLHSLGNVSVAPPLPEEEFDFELDPMAPVRAMREPPEDLEGEVNGVVESGSGSGSVSPDRGRGRGRVEEGEGEDGGSEQEQEQEQEQESGPGLGERGDVGKMKTGPGEQKQERVRVREGERERERADWGESFRIEWISTARVSFQRTKMIRNPWNHDREVKVSRDGTELEPGVGKRLVEEWAVLAREARDGEEHGDGHGEGEGEGEKADGEAAVV
ncbi:hypothetical protein H0H92_014742 [Tricholoma furcatifolium]|nr:hypothetical protein H0H92_014742 [Tricholoma furcatifolium]